MSILRDFIDNIFNNPPIYVEKPRPVRISYKDAGTRLEVYCVRVVYKNGQHKDLSFSIDNDHWKLVPKEMAYNRAYAFYRRKCKKIAARNEKTK